jgi:pimeloyl-ACP methyl ester carboxylesterase
LLCDEGLYKDVIDRLGAAIEAHVLISPKPRLEDSVADILARAPERFALVGTSYGGNLALEVALAAPERISALWLMGCDPAGPQAGGPDLAAGLVAAPDAVIEMLAGLVVHPDATEAKAEFKAMAGRIGAAAGAAQATALSVRQEATSRLGRLKMPVLALWGEADPLVAPAIGQAMAQALTHAQFHTFVGCGHLPTLEKPAEAAALFATFLGENAGAAA